MSAHAFFSSLTLQLTNSEMSGCSALRMTILAARRVLPPDLMTPAKASKPRMNETGPLAVPPPCRISREERGVGRFVPVSLPEFKSIASGLSRPRIDSTELSTQMIEDAEDF